MDEDVFAFGSMLAAYHLVLVALVGLTMPLAARAARFSE